MTPPTFFKERKILAFEMIMVYTEGERDHSTTFWGLLI